MSTPSASLNIGVLLLSTGAQLLDTSPVDLLAMTSHSYLSACQLPPPLTALGLPSIQVSYISPALSVPLTANLTITTTCPLTSPTIAPGTLDILMIPGPDPTEIPSEEIKSFIRAHATHPTHKPTILTICTGIFVAAHSGILQGRTATGPRGLLPTLRKQFPDTTWTDRRWERDGGTADGQDLPVIWTSAGITNGQDMVAALLREMEVTRGPLAELVCRLADVGERGQEYPNGQAREVGWWVWLIFRSWVKGLFGGGGGDGGGKKME